MTHGLAAHRFLNEHGVGFVVQALGNVHQLARTYQRFELGYENTPDISVVDHTHQSIAEMNGERRVYVKKRQADNVRARRFSSIDTHTEIPRPRLARADKNTLLPRMRIFCGGQRAEFFLAIGGIVSALHQTTGWLT